MKSSEPKRDPGCQLQVLPTGCEPPGIFDRARCLALRLILALERRLGRPGYTVVRDGRYGNDHAATAISDLEIDEGSIEEGDWVVVRPIREIKETLDASNRCRGLEFMPGMEKNCEKSFRVRKRVRAIFDERAWRMLKIRDTFLLDDCVCEGRGMYDKEGCDRCCYYFWKVDWLKKVR